VGRAVADYLPNSGPVIVGRDMRVDSNDLAEALIDGLTQQGRDVWDIGLVTTDMVYFSAGHFGDEAAGGVMVTASHNPGKYNGIKMCGRGAIPMGATNGLLDIKKLVMEDDFKPEGAKGNVTERSVVDEWVEQVMSFVNTDALKPYRVAVDAGNGMAGAIFPALEKKLPFEVDEMYFELDGTFPNHVANPHLFETLVEICKLIKEKQLDFGMAFDGDGDRGGLIDELGQPVPEPYMGAILAQYFLKKNPGATILYDVRTSHIVRDTIEAAGGKAVRSKVGGDVIKGQMRETGAVLGIELSGHYYFKDNHYSDSGLIGVMAAVSILAESGKKLSELVAPFKKYATSEEVNMQVDDVPAIMAKLEEKFGDGAIDKLDGLSVDYPTWWFNVRASNTEPLMRLNIEADDDATLQAKLAEVTAVITG
jgi:phosphomannomutase